MNSGVEVFALVEGKTERIFIKNLLAPYFAKQNIFLVPTLLSKPGEKGGDVRFVRARRDIGDHLKQRQDTYITMMVDYYRIDKDWPGFDKSKLQPTPSQKAEVINYETAKKVQELYSEQNKNYRFIPYVSMHEIEALYFSDPVNLARIMNVKQTDIESILRKCGEPEAINDNEYTAPSKRLESLSQKFRKTSTGIKIAETIGIERMRKQCPIFNNWICKIEDLKR